MSPAPRRHRNALIAGAAVVALTALASAALSGLLPGVPLRAGPLDGGGGSGSVPMQATDAGMLWALDLTNRSGSKIVLDSVKVTENPRQVKLLTDPYVWDDNQVQDSQGMTSISMYPLPLPADWKTPPRSGVNGHVVPSGDPAVLIEFARPAKASTVDGVTVDYHIGWQAFRKTFDMTLLICPPNDLAPCR